MTSGFIVWKQIREGQKQQKRHETRKGQILFLFFFFFLPSGQHLERLCHSKGHKGCNQREISNCLVLQLHHLCCIGRCDCTCYVCCRSSCCHHLSLRLLLLLSNLNYSQTLKPTSPWKLAGDENSSIHRSHTETLPVSSVCVRLSATLPWRIVGYRLNVRATRARMDRSL